MGNAFTLAIFGCIVFGCVLIVLYSLFGKRRSIFIAIPTAIVCAIAMFPLIQNPNRSSLKVGLVLGIGSAIGIIRQFRRPASMPNK